MAAERSGDGCSRRFCDVQIVTSSSIAKLLNLRKTLFDNGRRLALSSGTAQYTNDFHT
jgi:hypothetical protein